MSLTKTQICNMALYHLGTSKEIANVDSPSETSEEARTMRVFWDTAKEKILGEFPWPFATKVAALGQVEEDPTDEWGYSYSYPSDALAIRKIQSGLRMDNRQSVIPYQIAQDSGVKLIYTDLDEAIAEYTVNLTGTDLFTAEFCIALSYLLAHYAAPKLSKGDPKKMKNDMLVLYRLAVSEAKSKSLNEEQRDPYPDAEMIRGRE